MNLSPNIFSQIHTQWSAFTSLGSARIGSRSQFNLPSDVLVTEAGGTMYSFENMVPVLSTAIPPVPFIPGATIFTLYDVDILMETVHRSPDNAWPARVKLSGDAEDIAFAEDYAWRVKNLMVQFWETVFINPPLALGDTWNLETWYILKFDTTQIFSDRRASFGTHVRLQFRSL